MGVFDSIAIPALSTTITRVGGPLERGAFQPAGSNTWVPDTADTDVYYDGFGISAATGRPYFDTIAATQGEQGVLVINAGSGKPFLRTA